MESDNFEEKVKGWLSKGAEVSKKAMETVGGKVQDFTDKSVVKMEKKQLESKLEGKYLELGKKIYSIMAEDSNCEKCEAEGKKSSCLNLRTEENLKYIEKLQSEIKSLIIRIAEKAEEIK